MIKAGHKTPVWKKIRFTLGNALEGDKNTVDFTSSWLFTVLEELVFLEVCDRVSMGVVVIYYSSHFQ